MWAPLSESSINQPLVWAPFFMAVLPTSQMRTLRLRGVESQVHTVMQFLIQTHSCLSAAQRFSVGQPCPQETSRMSGDTVVVCQGWGGLLASSRERLGGPPEIPRQCAGWARNRGVYGLSGQPY